MIIMAGLFRRNIKLKKNHTSERQAPFNCSTDLLKCVRVSVASKKALHRLNKEAKKKEANLPVKRNEAKPKKE